MKRIFFFLLVVCAALGVSANSAFASSVHLKGGSNAKPSFTDNGLSLNSSGALSGLGNGDVLITLTAKANVTSTCTNQGGNPAPGQNPAPITVSGSEAIPGTTIQTSYMVGYSTTVTSRSSQKPSRSVPSSPLTSTRVTPLFPFLRLASGRTGRPSLLG